MQTIILAGGKGLSDEDKDKLKLETQISKLKTGPNASQKLNKKEQELPVKCMMI